jgi:hypothetical protein
MAKVVHVIGNGKAAGLFMNYPKLPSGLRYTCNLPGFAIPGAKATFMVDFKMMKAVASGQVVVPGNWILGMRPKKWCEMHPTFYMKFAKQIQEFYLDLPPYCKNYTDFNCGHMAVHYVSKKHAPEEVHMYGFDSMFGPELFSSTDLYLQSDRSEANSYRLKNNWRPIWTGIFNEFPETKFVLHHFHDSLQIPDIPDNVEVSTKLVKKKVK